ncbi:hypothetical protein CDZ96_15425 [Mameliella alba]|nr:hypothetical protein A9320_01055 [Ruegeria sp. PBVC088]OWV47338.1 hypothetical protein CDZ96_15425 [Mameliella alba]GGF70263.1 hypothetical protein GCM10011319_33670 [Mameliella alba]
MRGTAALAVLCLMAAPGTVLAQSYAAEFAQAVERCWVIDVNSEAADIGVTLAFSMLPDDRIQPDSVHLVRASSGSKAAHRQGLSIRTPCGSAVPVGRGLRPARLGLRALEGGRDDLRSSRVAP